MTTAELGAAGTIVAIGLPLVLAVLMIVRELRPLVMRAAPWATLPAVTLAGTLGASDVRLDFVLFGMRLGVTDALTRPFLLLTAWVWLAASVFAHAYLARDPRRARFWSWFLVTAGGNLGIVLARDVASFYLFYAVMTFAAYGLIVHVQTTEARRAGLVYLVMALAGEMLLIAAFFLTVGAQLNLTFAEVPRAVADSRHRDLIVGLVLVGFGVKAGALGVHMWLPLAHPVAPTPASAILSGALIKAGLLGALRFLPLGIVALPGAGLACVICGLAAALYAVVIGLTQPEPKTILAYSSISQMGLMTATLGVALAAPELASAAVIAIAFYAIHHALAKSALFLGTGVASATNRRWPRRLVLLGLALPALALAGAPLSSGALAKLSLKDVVTGAPWPALPLGALLAVGAVGTTLLVGHFLIAVARQPAAAARPGAGLWLPWLALLAGGVVIVVRPPLAVEPAMLGHAGHVWSALWPVLLGGALVAIAWQLARRGVRPRIRIPPGDVLAIVTAAGTVARRAGRALGGAAARLRSRLQATGTRLAPGRRIGRRVLRATDVAEAALLEFGTMGLVFLALAVLGVVLAWLA